MQGSVAGESFGLMSCGLLTQTASGFEFGFPIRDLTDIHVLLVTKCIIDVLVFAQTLATQYVPTSFHGAFLDTAYTPLGSPCRTKTAAFTPRYSVNVTELFPFVSPGNHVAMLPLLFEFPDLLQAVFIADFPFHDPGQFSHVALETLKPSWPQGSVFRAPNGAQGFRLSV